MKSKWLVFLLVGVFAVALIGGCGPAAVDDGNDVAEVATQYNIGVTVLPPSLNMNQDVLQYTSEGCLYNMLVYENLGFYPKLDGDPPQTAYDFVPKLATGWDVSYDDEGNQIWTVALREGVKWHDGKPFTSDDVVFSLKYSMPGWGLDKPIDWVAVEEDTGEEELWPEHYLAWAVDPHTVQWAYIDGYHQPEDYAPGWWLWDAIVPAHIFGPDGEGVYENWNEDPRMWDGEGIGTGPYRVKEFVADEYMLLERVDEYWGPMPAAERVLWQQFADSGAMLLALEAGVIDHSRVSVPIPRVAQYEADPNIEVSLNLGLGMTYMAFNLHPEAGYGPLQEKVLRQAIAYAIDAQDINNMLSGGYAEIATSFVFNDSPTYNPNVPDYAYDPVKAEALLVDAGYYKDNGYWHTPEGEMISFTLTTTTAVSDSGLMITTNLRDFGLDVRHQAIDDSTYRQYLYRADEGSMQAFLGGEEPSPDPWGDWVWGILADPYTHGSMWNETWYNSPEFNELYIAAMTATDLDEKKEILFRKQELLAEDLPYIFLLRTIFITAHRNDRWENWYDTMGGAVNWINEHSIRDVTPVKP